MKKLCTFLLLILPFIVVGQAPVNDDCLNAIEITDLKLDCDFYTFSTATFDFMAAECGEDSMKNIWFKFNARGPTLKVESFLFDDKDSYIQVFQFLGPPCDSIYAVPLACAKNKLVAGNLLDLDEEYYISISASSEAMTEMIVCISNSLTNTDPINDDRCNAISVPIDSSCINGTLENATYDVPNPSCHNADERSVWYRGVMPHNSNAMEIILEPLGLDTFPYKIGVYRLKNGTNCVDPPTFIGGGCGQGLDTFQVFGLVPGERYHIMVSSEIVDGHTFNICFRPIIPPAGCGLNDTCILADTIPLKEGDPLLCVQGCNIGAAIGPFDSSSYCTQFPYPSVYYKVYVDSTMDKITLRISGSDLDKPQLAIYYGECGDLTFVACDYGKDGLLEIAFDPPVKDTLYYIIASDITGRTGYFDLCIRAFHRIFECNYRNTLEVIETSLGSPLEGPYKAGEELHFRYTLDEWIPTHCNWLQGVVPVFINGWDRSSFERTGELKVKVRNPEPYADGEWGWHTSGDVHYNFNNPFKGFSEGDILSPGWFFLEDNVEDLDSSRGDGISCSDSFNLQWTVEFKVRIVPYPGCVTDTIFNALIEFVTFSDGEIGKRNRSACANDYSTIFSVPFTCCAGPILEEFSDTICSGETIDYLLPEPDTITEYRWSVYAGDYVDGASPTVGNRLRQTLTNRSYEPQLVEYTLYGRDTVGCYGPPAHYRITVLPKLEANAGGEEILACRDYSVRLGGSPTGKGGIPPLRYIWSDSELNGPNPLVKVDESKTMFLQIRDSYRCSARDTVHLVMTEAPKTDLPEVINICKGDSMTLDIKLTGTPPYTYNVSYDGVHQGSVTRSDDYITLDIVGDSDVIIKVDSLIDAVCKTEVSNMTEVIVRDSVVNELYSTICGDEVFFVGSQSFDETGIYEVELPKSSQYGCDSTVILHLTVNELITLSDTTIHYNDSTDIGTIAVKAQGGVAPYSYEWSTGGRWQFLLNVPGGIYTVTITDREGCKREFEFNLGNKTALDDVVIPQYVLYPQPVLAGNAVTLSLKDLEYGEYGIEFYSSTGIKVVSDKFIYTSGHAAYEKKIEQPGVYFWYIVKAGKIIVRGKCIVI